MATPDADPNRMDVDPNRMDIDPPEPSTADSTGPATPSSFSTPPTSQTGAGQSPSMDGANPPPWAKPAEPAEPAQPADKGKAKENGVPPPQPKKEEKAEPEPEPEVDISHVPPPDLKALLSKSRDPGAHLDAARLAVPELRVSFRSLGLVLGLCVPPGLKVSTRRAPPSPKVRALTNLSGRWAHRSVHWRGGTVDVAVPIPSLIPHTGNANCRHSSTRRSSSRPTATRRSPPNRPSSRPRATAISARSTVSPPSPNTFPHQNLTETASPRSRTRRPSRSTSTGRLAQTAWRSTTTFGTPKRRSGATSAPYTDNR